MRLVAHEVGLPLKMVPGRGNRTWMDNTPQRYAYRCIPLAFSNGTGWELLSPCTFQATWNGLPGKDAITFQALDGYPHLKTHVDSHFGDGVLTIHPGYLFRTEPGWGVMARGAPNHIKDGIAPLEGLVETDWLPFTFTMNWKFTRPGRVVFEKDEALCFVTPVPHMLTEQITPEITRLGDNPELLEEFKSWATSRNNFNKALFAGDKDTVKQGWQRNYVRGTTPTGGEAGEMHRSKRKLPMPVRVQRPAPLTSSPIDIFASLKKADDQELEQASVMAEAAIDQAKNLAAEVNAASAPQMRDGDIAKCPFYNKERSEVEFQQAFNLKANATPKA